MTKTFASRGDLKPKKITFKKLSPSCYAFTAEGDPNTGVVVGDDGVLVIDAQATPLMAREVIRRIDDQHAVVADDDAGVRVALGGEGVEVAADLGEGDRLLGHVARRGEALAHSTAPSAQTGL